MAESKVQDAQWVLERTLGFIAAAEVKVGAITALGTAMLAALGAMLPDSPMGGYAWTLCAATILFVLCAFACAAMVLIPRTGGPPKSLVFFGKIAALDRDEYGTQLKSVSDDALLKDLADQIHRNAEIACEKFKWVTRSLRFSVGAAFFWFWAVGVMFWAHLGPPVLAQ